jgi:hypothetical protein
MASVMMDGEHITTFSRSEVLKAAPRMKDTSRQTNKAWEPSPFVVGYTPCIEKRLSQYWDNFFAKPHDEQAELLKESRAVFTARQACKKHKTVDASTTPKPIPKPNKGKSKWRLNTQVATNTKVLPGGVASPETGDSLAPVIWVTGLITKYDGGAACPYEIQWDTQPDPIVHRKNALEVAQLVQNFKFCAKHRLLRGYVDLDLLWVHEPVPGSLGNQHIQYAVVLPFDPVMNKYKIQFRSGIWSWKSEEEVIAAKQFTEAVITGEHATWTIIYDAESAGLEPRTYKVMESQEQGSECAFSMGNDPQLQFQDITVSSHTVELVGPGKKPASRTMPSRLGKLTSNTNAPRKVIKYTSGKTKVPTMNGSNSLFPELKRNRTGRTVGTLHRIDGSALLPYRIV